MDQNTICVAFADTVLSDTKLRTAAAGWCSLLLQKAGGARLPPPPDCLDLGGRLLLLQCKMAANVLTESANPGYEGSPGVL